MAKNKNLPVETGSEIRDTYVDPETQSVVTVSEGQIRELMSLELQIATSMTSMMLTLREVRDGKLYLLRSDTFEEYLRTIGIAPRTARRQLQIADAFGDSTNFSELSKLPQSILLDAAKNDDIAQQLRDGELRTADGEIISVEEIVNSGNAKLKAELEKSQRTARNFKKKYEEADEDRKLREAELGELKEQLGPENFKRIKTKKEAMSALFAAEGEMNSIVQALDSIESDEVEVVAKLGALLGHIKYAVQSLEDKWMPHLVKVGEQE